MRKLWGNYDTRSHGRWSHAFCEAWPPLAALLCTAFLTGQYLKAYVVHSAADYRDPYLLLRPTGERGVMFLFAVPLVPVELN